MKSSIFKLCVMLLIMGTTFALPSKVLAQPSSQLKYNPFAEQWVSYQIATGKVADLGQHYPNPDDRVIRGSFVVALLQNRSSVIAQNGISIKNATVSGDLFLQHADISFPITFEALIFEGYVSFCRDHFYSSLSITRSIFKSSVNFCAAKSEDVIFLTDSEFEASADFTGVEVRGDLALQNASFAGSVQFGAAKVQGSLFLDDATFADPTQTIGFDNIHVDRSIFLNRATFYGSARFMDAYIGSHFAADDVKFTSSDGNANFENMFVNKSVYLNRAVFNGAANFSNVNAEDYFIANNAQFNNPEQVAYFENMHTKAAIHLGNAIFTGPVNFANVNADTYFILSNAQFKGEGDVTFSSAKVGKILYINQAAFAGPVNFTYIDIGSSIEGTEVHFNDKDGLVTFGGAKVNDFVYLNKTVFSGPVDFRYTQIGENFEAQDARFTNSDQQPFFGYMRVGVNLLIDRVVFSGSANLGNVQIAGSFSATEAQFNSQKHPASFNDMKAKYALLNSTIFLGPANFGYSEIDANFNINKSQFKNSQAKVDFGEMTIGKSLFMADAVINGAIAFDYIDIGNVIDLSNSRFNNSKEQTVSLASMNIKGYIFLNGTAFNGPVSFSRTVTEGLFASGVTWPEDRGTVNVTGLTYREIEVRDSKDNTVNFISLLEQSPFEIQSYQRLENYYLNQGQPGYADYIYVKSKQRERRDGGMPWYYWRWLWNLFLDIFVLYGRDPLRVILWCLLFVVIGYFVFRNKEKMIPVVETTRSYRPFLYSLDLFIPIINLGYAKAWEPRPEHKIALIYSKVLPCLAWILIPIAILAIAGVFR